MVATTPGGAEAGSTPTDRRTDQRRRRTLARLWHLLKLALPPLVVLIIILGAWEITTATLLKDKPYLYPGPSAVVHQLWVQRGTISHALLITFIEAALGFGAAIVGGVGGAILMSQTRLLERSLYPYAVLLQTVPIVAVAPIITLWFGYGQTSVVIVAYLIGVFPILTNTLMGLRSTPHNTLDLFRMHKAGRLREFVKLRFPHALPSIVTGLRISAGLAVVGAMVGEFLIGSGGSQGGLGVQILFAEGAVQTALMFAEVLVATLLGFLFFLSVSIVGHLSLRTWHESARKGE